MKHCIQTAYLHVALDDVEGDDEGVGEAARQNTAEHALEVVLVGVGHGVAEARIPLLTVSRRG